MFAEEIAVVAEKHDAGIVELAIFLERLEDHADAFVDRRHHGGAQADFFLLAGVYGVEHGLGLGIALEVKAFGPRRFLLDDFRWREHVG